MIHPTPSPQVCCNYVQYAYREVSQLLTFDKGDAPRRPLGKAYRHNWFIGGEYA